MTIGTFDESQRRAARVVGFGGLDRSLTEPLVKLVVSTKVSKIQRQFQ
jgi:hypothetical protein